MISESFRRRLEHGVHSRWARDMDEQHLAGLLWAVGEFGAHERVTRVISRQLDRHESDVDPGNKEYARARLILEVMSNMVYPWFYENGLMRPALAEELRLIPANGIGRPVFSAELQSTMRLGKYSAWSSDINEDRLLAALSLVGEYGSLTHVVAEQLDRHQAEVERRTPYARCRGSLDVISDVVRGGRFTMDDVCGRVKMATRKAWSSRFKPAEDWWTG